MPIDHSSLESIEASSTTSSGQPSRQRGQFPLGELLSQSSGGYDFYPKIFLKDVFEQVGALGHPQYYVSAHDRFSVIGTGFVEAESLTAFPRTQSSTAHDSAYRHIYRALSSEPVLDGYDHPAEVLLTAAFRESGSTTAHWIKQEIGASSNIDLAADLLRILSRFKPYTAAWRHEIVRAALESSRLPMRDAALQAIEAWQDASLLPLLSAHREPVAWLRKYTEQILHDLQE